MSSLEDVLVNSEEFNISKVRDSIPKAPSISLTIFNKNGVNRYMKNNTNTLTNNKATNLLKEIVDNFSE